MSAITASQEALIKLLADGAFHSGVELGGALGVSRTAVWKQLAGLEEIGLHVEKLKGKGYRIVEPLNLLHRQKLESSLSSTVLPLIESIELHQVLESTNQRLINSASNVSVGKFRICLSEFQSAGRGRRGRSWVSPFARNVCLSIGYSFQDGFAALEGYSLAAGVMVAEVLLRLGIKNVGLKWPNDIWIGDAKVGGILIELAGEQSGPCQVVVGLGLNVLMREQELKAPIEQKWTSVAQAVGEGCDRNLLVASLIEALVMGTKRFEIEGLTGFLQRWHELDALQGRPVCLLGVASKAGICRGINRYGHLLLETDVGLEEVSSGEVSLRLS